MEKMYVVYIDFGKGQGWERFGGAFDGDEYGRNAALKTMQMIFRDGFKAKVEAEDKREVMSRYSGETYFGIGEA